ncbi:MAG: hypothetical protein U1E45_12620 [Geminicoccaceae bacterium]
MTRTLVPLLAVLALAGCQYMDTTNGPGTEYAQCSGGQNPTQPLCLDQVDHNGDGYVSQNEWDSSFHAADTNNDGQVSSGEFAAAGGAGGRGGR